MPTAFRIWPLLLLLGLMPVADAAADADEVARLQQELAALRARLDVLERRVAAQAGQTLQEHDLQAAATRIPPEPVIEPELLGEAVIGAERIEEARVAAEPEPAPIRFGGALRFNYHFLEDVASSRTRRGDAGFDLFRLNVDGEIDDILLSAEYRYTPDMDMIRYGWIGYRFSEEDVVRLGVQQVPFGLLPFASHNFWYGVPHYAGFADNYDLGIGWERRDGPWHAHLAFFKNEELGDAASLSRFAPDLVREDAAHDEEINRFNARLAYTFAHETGCEHELGVSAQRADLVNALTDGRGSHWAAAGHLDTRCGRWNVQLQGAHYVYDPKRPPGESGDSVRLGGFGTSWDMASRGTLAVANVAYNFPVPHRALDQLICYNNYSRLIKERGSGRDSELNTVGCGIGAGPLYAYVDLILARNMLFFGEGSMAAGGEDRWRSRLNINIGYYW